MYDPKPGIEGPFFLYLLPNAAKKKKNSEHFCAWHYVCAEEPIF